MAGFSPLRPLVRYVDFQGRSRRAEFWSYMALLWLMHGLFYGYGAWLLFSQGKPDLQRLLTQGLPLLMVMVLVGLGLFLPTLAVEVRRLHDSNRSGWWLILPRATTMIAQSIVYMVNGDRIMSATMDAQQQMAAMKDFDMTKIFWIEWGVMSLSLPYVMAGSLGGGLVLLLFFLLPGTRGPNRFGPDPKAS